MKWTRLLAFLAAQMLLVSACHSPSRQSPTPSGPQVVFTAAAQTLEAQLTQNALLVAVTPAPSTPLPTATNIPGVEASLPEMPVPDSGLATPTDGDALTCDAAQFMGDVTVPDGSQYSPNAAFTKIWRLKNVGSCTWDSSYALVFDTGDMLGGAEALPLADTVAPGQEVDLAVALTAPAKAGTYRGYWQLRNASGETLPVEKGYAGRSFFVEIQVKTGADEGSLGKFAVTGLSFDAKHGASGLWLDLYIDEPNRQQFGRARLDCL